jgi:hypothetical protein
LRARLILIGFAMCRYVVAFWPVSGRRRLSANVTVECELVYWACAGWGFTVDRGYLCAGVYEGEIEEEY